MNKKFKDMDYLELSKYELSFNATNFLSKDHIFIKNLTNKRIAFKVFWKYGFKIKKINTFFR